MSSVFKGVKKVFKKVVKTVKKILPVIVLAAAVVFTAGAALAAVAPAAATGVFGWSTALTNTIAGAGFSPAVAGIINGAVTNAITGAAIGGVLSAVSGGDIGKGMLAGGLTGAVGGGIYGAFNPLAAPGTATTAAAAAARPGYTAGQEGAGAGAGGQGRLLTLTDTRPAPMTSPGETAAIPPTTGVDVPSVVGRQSVAGAQGGPAGTGVLEESGVAQPRTGLDRLLNSRVVAQGIGGAAQAMLAGSSTDRADAARVDAQAEEDARNSVTANYGGSIVPPGVQTSAQPRTGLGRWAWDREAKQMTFLPGTAFA